MNVFLKFVFSLIAHAAWKRIGGGGAVPPIRLPRSKRVIGIPALSSWQLMAAMWVVKKLWNRHGDTVKTRLTTAKNPVVRRVGSYIPDATAGAATAAQNTVSPSPSPAATQPSYAPSSLGNTAAPIAAHPAPSHATQRLDEGADDSLLSSLRNGAAGAAATS
jgi:hypothetical protein